MAELLPSITPLILPRIGQAPAIDGGLREWLVRGSYTASLDETTGAITLGNVAPDNLISYLNYDYQRFAIASWESFYVATLESSHASLAGWPLLKLYYSAFFAAHALLRATGHSIVQVEKRQIDQINNIIAITGGISPGLKAGIFRATVRQVQPGQLNVIIAPHSDGSGVHDGFWKSFTSTLDEFASAAVASGAANATLFVAGVGELSGRTKGWLSARRNDINYRHNFGVWFPIENAKSLNKRLLSVKRIPSAAINLQSALDPVLPPFISTTQYLACLNAEIADYIAARSSGASAFGARWRRFQALHKSTV